MYLGKNGKILQVLENLQDFFKGTMDFAYLNKRYKSFYSSLHDNGVEAPKEPIKFVERESGCIAVDFVQIEPSSVMPRKNSSTFSNDYLKDASELWQPLSQEMNRWLKEMEEAQCSISHEEKRRLAL